MEKIYDIGIIGGGPAGYSAALRAVQKGLKVILFEKECAGGVCLNKGCIPTKTILHCTQIYKNLKKADKFGINIENFNIDYKKVFERKNNIVEKIQKNLLRLLNSYDIEIIKSEARIISQNIISADNHEYSCKNIIIASGAKPKEIKGLETDGSFIVNSDQLLQMQEIPENILIAGSGAIGIEWSRIFCALGKNVTIIEIASRILPPADKEISVRLERLLKKDKIKFFKECTIDKIENRKVFLNSGAVLEPDMILVAAGRSSVLPYCVNIIQNGKFIEVNENFQTNFNNIFAIGDVNGKLQLAHAAVHQAIGVVDFISCQKPVHFISKNVPSVIYGSPEIAWVGEREEDLAGTEYKVSCFPSAALGKAQAEDEIDGIIKVISINNKIAGAHIISPEASAMIQQFALMIDNELEIQEILKTTFAHPSYSEGVFESVLGLEKLSLCLPKEN